MINENLISAEQLIQVLEKPNITIVDCSYDLSNRKLGYLKYIEGHIPGAWYAHTEDELSGPVTAHSGRHPLPTPKAFQSLLQSLGIKPNTTIIVYDDSAGLFASRFWWLAKCYGHKDICILDGGIQAFKCLHPLSRGLSPSTFSTYPLRSFNNLKYYSTDQLLVALEYTLITLVDVRSKERFLGLKEPIDPVAGHIKGAINMPHNTHLDLSGKFRPIHEITNNFLELIALDKPLVFSCGSGITASHSFFALTLTGLHETAAIYPGSWSEWIQDSNRPIIQASHKTSNELL